MTGFLNYALGRVDFKNPVTGGFVTEAGHIIDNELVPRADGPDPHADRRHDLPSRRDRAVG